MVLVISSQDFLPIVRWMWSEWARCSHELLDPTPGGATNSSVVDINVSRQTGDYEPTEDYYILQRIIPEFDPIYFKIMKLKYLHHRTNYMISLEMHKSDGCIQNIVLNSLHMTWGMVRKENHIKLLLKKLRRKTYVDIFKEKS